MLDRDIISMCGMSVISWRLFDRRWHDGSNHQALTHFRLTRVGQRKHLHFRAAAIALICTIPIIYIIYLIYIFFYLIYI